MKESGIGTKCVQAGYTPENGGPRQIPIIQSTTLPWTDSLWTAKCAKITQYSPFCLKRLNITFASA